ncbi:serine hydrolase [Natrononativus amylolyticus]|uniref:serine hydrolase n=1 Tax=Natrononativus amylolyticus TaxID=2963434 RepID=UPI0020CCCDC0|nr:serine hydrolase [Natrononativus amylolyticus]
MPPSLEAETRRTIDDLLRERMREDAIPGLSLAVVDGSAETGVAYAAGYGSRDLETNEPATPETVYGIGSVSKSFAALAVMQLVDAGELGLEESVTEYLSADVPEEITPHHLLTHTSGYPSLATSEALIARQMGVGEAGVPLGSRADFYAHVEGARGEIAAEPGERWAYCNSGYTMLGDVVEAVSGVGFTDYVEAEILEPLGMRRSTYDGDRFEAFEDRMTPYALEDGEPEESALPVRERSAAAGGLLAPVTDLANYVRFHLQGGEFGGERLVGREALETQYGAHADTPAGPYGYGWRTRDVAGHELIGHGGSIAVSSAYVGFSLECDLGIALLANTSPGYGLAELGTGVFAALAGADPRELPFFERKRRFAELSGEYESYRGIKEAEVEAEGGVLRLRVGGPIGEGSWTTLIPEDVAAGEFYALTAAGNRQPVRFERDGDDLSLYIDRWRLHRR